MNPQFFQPLNAAFSTADCGCGGHSAPAGLQSQNNGMSQGRSFQNYLTPEERLHRLLMVVYTLIGIYFLIQIIRALRGAA